MKLWLNSVNFWLIVVAVVMVITTGLSVWKWEWLRSGAQVGALESNATTIRNLGIVIGGAIALVFAIWRGIVAQNQSEHRGFKLKQPSRVY